MTPHGPRLRAANAAPTAVIPAGEIARVRFWRAGTQNFVQSEAKRWVPALRPASRCAPPAGMTILRILIVIAHGEETQVSKSHCGGHPRQASLGAAIPAWRGLTTSEKSQAPKFVVDGRRVRDAVRIASAMTMRLDFAQSATRSVRSSRDDRAAITPPPTLPPAGPWQR